MFRRRNKAQTSKRIRMKLKEIKLANYQQEVRLLTIPKNHEPKAQKEMSPVKALLEDFFGAKQRIIL